MSQTTKWAAMCAAGIALAGFGLNTTQVKADPGLVVRPAVIQTTSPTSTVPVQEVGWRGGWRGGGIGVYRGGWARPGVGIYVGRPRYVAPRYYGGYYGGYRPNRNYGYAYPGYGYGYATPAYGYSYPAYGYGYAY